MVMSYSEEFMFLFVVQTGTYIEYVLPFPTILINSLISRSKFQHEEKSILKVMVPRRIAHYVSILYI